MGLRGAYRSPSVFHFVLFQLYISMYYFYIIRIFRNILLIQRLRHVQTSAKLLIAQF